MSKENKIEKTSIWEVVQQMEKVKENTEKELGEIRATMIVNFGENGWNTKNVIHKGDSTITMVLKVLNHFYDKIKGVAVL